MEQYTKGGLYKWSSDESSDNNLDMSSEMSNFENDPEAETRHQSSFKIISADVLQNILKTFTVCKTCGGQLKIVELFHLVQYGCFPALLWHVIPTNPMAQQ